MPPEAALKPFTRSEFREKFHSSWWDRMEATVEQGFAPEEPTWKDIWEWAKTVLDCGNFSLPTLTAALELANKFRESINFTPSTYFPRNTYVRVGDGLSRYSDPFDSIAITKFIITNLYQRHGPGR